MLPLPPRPWPPPTKTKPTEILPANQIHLEAVFAATPGHIYTALTDPAEFAKMTGEPAEISPGAGGVFSLFGARIEGLDNAGFPEGQPESPRTGWHEHYWEPLKKYFA